MTAPPRPESLVSFATILHGVQKARLSHPPALRTPGRALCPAHPPALRNRFSPGPTTDCFAIDYPVTCAVPSSPTQTWRANDECLGDASRQLEAFFNTMSCPLQEASG